jgi:hypothetical protein
MLKIFIRILITTGVLITSVNLMAADKVVVVPLFDSPAAVPTSSGFKLVKASDSSEVGRIIGMPTDTSWAIINNNGYLVILGANGVPVIRSVLYNDGACAGTPLYLQHAVNKNDSGSIIAIQGFVFTLEGIGTYYVAKNAGSIDNAAYNRRRNSPTNCQSQSISVNTVVPILANDPAVTGVPNGGYGAVTIQ